MNPVRPTPSDNIAVPALNRRNIVDHLFSFLDDHETAVAAGTCCDWNTVSKIERSAKSVSLRRLAVYRAILSSSKKERYLPEGAMCQFGTSDYIAWMDAAGVLHFCDKETMEDLPETIDLAGAYHLFGSGRDDSIPVYGSADRATLCLIDRANRKKFPEEIDVGPILERLPLVTNVRGEQVRQIVIAAYGTKINEPIFFLTNGGYGFSWSKKKLLSEPIFCFPEKYEGSQLLNIYKKGNCVCLFGQTKNLYRFISTIDLSNPKNKATLVHSPVKNLTVSFDEMTSQLYVSDGVRIASYTVTNQGVKENAAALSISSLSRLMPSDCYPVFDNEMRASPYGVTFRLLFKSLANNTNVESQQFAIWNPRRSPMGDRVTYPRIEHQGVRISQIDDLIFTEEYRNPAKVKPLHTLTGEMLPSHEFPHNYVIAWCHIDDDIPNSITLFHQDRIAMAGGANNRDINVLTVFSKPKDFKFPAEIIPKPSRIARVPVPVEPTTRPVVPVVPIPEPLGQRLVSLIQRFLIVLESIRQFVCRLFCCRRRPS